MVRCGRGEIRSSGDLLWPVFVHGPESAQRQLFGNANMHLGDFDAYGVLSALQPRLAASARAPEAREVVP